MLPKSSIQSQVLDLPPSCIEFCPDHPEYFLVGTYNLEKDEPLKDEDEESAPSPKNTQSRNGSVIVFRLQDRSMTRLQTLSQPSAILDLHFQLAEGRRDVCAVASSTATLSIFRLSPTPQAGHSSNSNGPLTHVSTSRIPGIGEDVLFLSCAWHPSIPDLIAVSTSTGEVHVVKLQGQPEAPGTLMVTHSLEAWTVVFSPCIQHLHHPLRGGEGGATVSGESRSQETPDTITLYSGGDDSSLRYVSAILGNDVTADGALSLQTPYPAARIDGHGAGVTAILPLSLEIPGLGRGVVTGSYDDHIRLYAVQSLLETYGARRAKLLAEENLGGGVWRLKLIDQVVDNAAGGQRRWRARILASCMHAGARIVDIEGDLDGKCEISVAARFEEHKSMNYGSDFCETPHAEGLLCVSTSFYDKLLCLWEVDDDVHLQSSGTQGDYDV